MRHLRYIAFGSACAVAALFGAHALGASAGVAGVATITAGLVALLINAYWEGELHRAAGPRSPRRS